MMKGRSFTERLSDQEAHMKTLSMTLVLLIFLSCNRESPRSNNERPESQEPIITDFAGIKGVNGKYRMFTGYDDNTPTESYVIIDNTRWEFWYIDETGKTYTGMTEAYQVSVNRDPGQPIREDGMRLKMNRTDKNTWEEATSWFEWKMDSTQRVNTILLNGSTWKKVR